MVMQRLVFQSNGVTGLKLSVQGVLFWWMVGLKAFLVRVRFETRRSLVLFAIAEEVYSFQWLGCFKEDYQWLVEKVFSHLICFSPDHIFIFYSGEKKSLENLLKVLSTYQVPSGQIVSRDKSKLFDGGTYFREDAVQTSTWRQFLCLVRWIPGV